MERISTASPPKPSARDAAILLVAAILGAAIYLFFSARIDRIGFPLDDSWIHLTYARNLAQRGEWAFQPGHLSAGSTSPLWTFLLAIGFWLHLGPYVWTYFLGAPLIFGFFAVDDIAGVPDAELYDRILSEFPSWMTAARQAGILR